MFELSSLSRVKRKLDFELAKRPLLAQSGRSTKREVRKVPERDLNTCGGA